MTFKMRPGGCQHAQIAKDCFFNGRQGLGVTRPAVTIKARVQDACHSIVEQLNPQVLKSFKDQ